MIAVIRPTAEGRWSAATGLGSHTQELGQYTTEAAAREAVADAGRIVAARFAENGYIALIREDREQAAAEVGITVGWMLDGRVQVVRFDGHQARVFGWFGPWPHHLGAEYHADRAALADQGLVEEYTLLDQGRTSWRRTWLGDIVAGALAAGHMDRAVVICGGAARNPTTDYHRMHNPDRPCPHCLGQMYLGDLEPAPTRAVLVLVDPVAAPEIAVRLQVGRQTVDNWRQRDGFPEPDATVGGRPVWSWHTIRDWAHRTGRLTREDT